MGWPFCITGLLVGSFATTIGGLSTTQGITYGVGFVVLNYPIISMVDEWWIARNGMAFGLISAASGVAGTVMSLILEAMLNQYGYETTLQASAVAVAMLFRTTSASTQRTPTTCRSECRGKGELVVPCKAALLDLWSFYLGPRTWLFFPSLYLPSYATAIGLNSMKDALLLASMSNAQVLGQFAFGCVSDKHILSSALAAIASASAMCATVGLWGTAKLLGLLLDFSLVYGFFGYGFGKMRVARGRAVSKDPSAAVATYSIFVYLQGIGNVSVGPISAALLSQRVRIDDYGVSRYKNLVVFTGACLFASALTICSWHLLRLFWALT